MVEEINCKKKKCKKYKHMEADFECNVLYVYINQFSLMCSLRPVFPYWFFSLHDLSIDVSGVLKSPILCVCVCVCNI